MKLFRISLWAMPVSFLVLSLAAGCVAQSARKKDAPKTVKPVASGIRQIDFFNYSYPSSLCSEELRELSKTVQVKDGNFQTDEVYFGVVDNIITYGDMTADGREEAVVHLACGERIANFGFSEVLLYTKRGEETVLLAHMSDRDMENDYFRFFPGGILQRIVNGGIKIRNGKIIIQRYAEGSLSSPDYIVTFIYGLTDNGLVLIGRPQRVVR